MRIDRVAVDDEKSCAAFRGAMSLRHPSKIYGPQERLTSASFAPLAARSLSTKVAFPSTGGPLMAIARHIAFTLIAATMFLSGCANQRNLDPQQKEDRAAQ